MPMASDSRPLDVVVEPREIVHPKRVTLDGDKVRLEPLAEGHIESLYKNTKDFPSVWDYMGQEAFKTRDEFEAFIRNSIKSPDPMFFAVIVKSSSECVGYLTLMRIDPANRCVEVGNVLFSPALQRTTHSTEAQYLLAKYVFDDLQYRRYEWKCHNMNAPSKRAADRLGFKFEGIFRKHMIYKGRNRDTCWFAFVDDDWPVVKAGFEKYLDSSNFDQEGNQKEGLKAIREKLA